MGQLYASAVSTVVLQIKEIPPRPTDFDGKLCLFALAKGIDEDAIRTAFGGFGKIIAVIDRRLPPMERDEIAVHFTSHQAVLDALEKGPVPGICGGIGALYTDRPYDNRGWYASTGIAARRRRQRNHTPDHWSHTRPGLRAQVLL